MANLTVVSTTFLPYILGIISIVLNLFSNGKSNRCFNNCFALELRESIHSFNFVFKWKIKPLFQQFFCPCILTKLSIVSILFSNGKCNRCFNNFLAVYFSQSIHSLRLVFKWNIWPLFQHFYWPCILAKLSIVSILFSNGKSNRCFSSFLAVHFRSYINSFKLVVKWKPNRCFNIFFGRAFWALYL